MASPAGEDGLEGGEVLEGLVDVGCALGRTEPQVLLDGETEEQRAILWHVGKAITGDEMGSAALDGPPEDPDVSGDERQQGRRGEQRGGLAGAVGPEQGHDLTLVDVQVEVPHDGYADVPGAHLLDLEERGHQPPPLVADSPR
jgi:hypothetical protein